MILNWVTVWLLRLVTYMAIFDAQTLTVGYWIEKVTNYWLLQTPSSNICWTVLESYNDTNILSYKNLYRHS